MTVDTVNDAKIPAFELFRRLRFMRAGPHGRPFLRRESAATLGIVLLAWMPLALLAGWNGRLTQGQRSFTDDVAVHARLLIELPLLLYFRRFVDRLCGLAVDYFPRAGMVDHEHLPEYRARVARIARLGDSPISIVIIVGLAYAFSFLEFRVSAGLDWWRGAPHSLSPAGGWYYFFARPLVVALVLSWLWALVLWARLLKSLLGLPLRLTAYHPDTAAGLGPLLRAHFPFAVLSFALSSDVAGGLANVLIHSDVPVLYYRNAALLFVIGSTVLLLAPMAIASPALFRARQRALLERGELASVMSSKMAEQSERALREGAPAEYFPLFDSYWSLTESTVLVTRTRALPISKSYLLLFLAAAALPISCAALARVPAKQALEQIFSLLTV